MMSKKYIRTPNSKWLMAYSKEHRAKNKKLKTSRDIAISHMPQATIILGIDPGTSRIGYGVIKKERGALIFLDAGILKVKNPNPQRALLEIKKGLESLIKKWRPDMLAVEKLYFSKNQKTAIEVAQARGVIILAGLEAGIEIREYSPNEIKSGVAGYGFADKKAVAKMVNLILRTPRLKIIDDASDALAIAIFAAQKERVSPTA